MTPKAILQSDISLSSRENSQEVNGNPNNVTTTNQSSFYFLSEEAAEALPKYQYKGQDLSLVYKYILSPLASFCVNNLTPRWIAPNTITLTGLLFMVASYIAMWYYVPMLLLSPDTTNPEIPRWIFLWNAIATLLYQTFDNMDGKQARRVGASSPLGLLFDHGCDAVNTLFGSANWMVTLALTTDDQWCVAVAVFGPYALMYVSTWEEFYTGELIMPIINGPNEGLWGSVVLSLVSYWYGPEIWQEENVMIPWDSIRQAGALSSDEPLRNADVLLLVSSLLIVQEVVTKSFTLSRDYGARVVTTMIPFGTLLGCFLLLGWKRPQLLLSFPRTSLHLCSILFVEMTTELMLLHVTGQTHQYKPFRWILFPLVLLTVVILMKGQLSSDFASDFLIAYASAAGTYLVLKVAIVIHELCSILDIWCFDITSPRQSRKALKGD